MNAKSGRNLSFAVSPIPASGGSLAECASGAYNSHWQKLGQNLVANKLPNTYVRFGHEMNGNYYRWTIANNNKANYIGCFQQFVNTVRATSGSNFKFVWNINGGGYSADTLISYYPGDAVVDYIAADVYDQAWAPNTYPYPSPCDSACISTHQVNAWNSALTSQNAGLQNVAAFAKLHAKPVAIPEWGVGSRPDGHGGLDDPYFIQKMSEFINDANNNVAWTSYEDFTAADFNARISQVPATLSLSWPNSSAKFIELFRTPVVSAVSDTVVPTVSINAPTAGATASGAVAVSVSAADNVGISKIEFYIDGALAQTGTSNSYSWNTSSVSNASHAIKVIAYDAANNSAFAVVSITVSNSISDAQPPITSFVLPLTGTTLSNAVPVEAKAVDNVAVAKVEFYLDNVLKATELSAPYCMAGNLNGVCNSFITSQYVDGSHTFMVKAYDSKGNVGTASVATAFNNNLDTVPPIVSLINPISGSVVKGLIGVQAQATDNVKVTKVEFYVDNVPVTTELVSPYCLAGDVNGVCNGWDSTKYLDGDHTILAKAYDAAGNATSDSVVINVSNTPASTSDTTIPSVTFTAPRDGSNISNKVPVSVSATDNVAVTYLQIKLDGVIYASGSSDSLSFTLNTRSLKVGAHTLSAVAKDAAGNTATKSITVYR